MTSATNDGLHPPYARASNCVGDNVERGVSDRRLGQGTMDDPNMHCLTRRPTSLAGPVNRARGLPSSPSLLALGFGQALGIRGECNHSLLINPRAQYASQ